MDQNISQLTQQLANLLILRSDRICTAESCTGGLIAKTFTDLAGSSEWFDRGFVTYSNQAKIDMLGVNPSTLSSFGAVSEEVAKEMASGALQHSEGQVSISVTGIAGPGGGNEMKPVGTVWFGFAIKKSPASTEIYSEKQWFSGDRESVRTSSLMFAINHIHQLLK